MATTPWESLRWSSLCLKDCSPWKGPMLEQFMKNCSLREGPMLEMLVVTVSHGRDPTLEQGKNVESCP